MPQRPRRQRVAAHRQREVAHERQHRPTPPANLASQLLVTRQQAAVLLACSCSKLWRMEKDGLLRPIKLGPQSSCQTYYATSDLHALVNAGR
jgi:hypothetical protein